MRTIRLRLKERSYDITIGHGLLKNIGALLRGLGVGRDAVIITNGVLARLYKKILAGSLKKSGFSVRFELVPDSEKAKSTETATKVINAISVYDKNKDIFIIALGGGVVGDLSGFVAAVYKRGVPYIQVPTTLLAQVDSAIGGKVALDLSIAKNLVGAFYQPKAVFSDISLLGTLSKRQLRSGLAEIIKYGVIKDKDLFEFLEKSSDRIFRLDKKALEYVVWRSSDIKARVVEKDEFDKKDLRAILNYGHTIGHAIEAASTYSDIYNHGEAVAVGMVAAARIAKLLGMINSGEAERIGGLIKKCGLPVRIKSLKFSDIYESHLHDKKFIRGKNRFVLPAGIGSVRVVEDVPDAVIRQVITGLFH